MGEADLQRLVMDTVVDVLSEDIPPKLLRQINTKRTRKKLFRALTNEVFYKLLTEGKLSLYPGFGSIVLKKQKERDKKIYNRQTGKMDTKKTRVCRVVYRPGESVRDFL